MASSQSQLIEMLDGIIKKCGFNPLLIDTEKIDKKDESSRLMKASSFLIEYICLILKKLEWYDIHYKIDIPFCGRTLIYRVSKCEFYGKMNWNPEIYSSSTRSKYDPEMNQIYFRSYESALYYGLITLCKVLMKDFEFEEIMKSNFPE